MKRATRKGAALAARAPTRRARRSLATYRAKRDFTISPEPRGRPAVPTRRRSFCVQQHLASRLHYDLRLEHHGVLLSWAVPKGPSRDPAVKRLAVAVEDHPVAYGAFEGVIPSGYGAGIVLLWDRGSWEPLDDDVASALAKGHLRFVLHGTKLQGGWHLIRTGRHGSKDWLLAKMQDSAAMRGDDAERHPESVVTGGGLAHILAREPRDPWPDQPPVTGGETGQRFADIIAESRRLRRRRRSVRKRGVRMRAPKQGAAARAGRRT